MFISQEMNSVQAILSEEIPCQTSTSNSNPLTLGRRQVNPDASGPSSIQAGNVGFAGMTDDSTNKSSVTESNGTVSISRYY